MLTGKQKRFLRKEAHHLKPIFQIGKSGVHDTFIREIDEALEARELLKITVLQNAEMTAEEAAHQIAEPIGADIVQVLGHTITLYKPSTNHKHIELPR
ncbi:ribosome assembly RNA-binding protein YhbY [Tuberibacillus calidus]|uniref:ribosome assembly RNA-binding protein YhbY n=1 Tax=Tuberibacillus calidus TaxID=340097 RepID=UPI0003FF75BB|nr:ribosome assembly RNA-binding protein YhbY [Tuberibacillus calidus]